MTPITALITGLTIGGLTCLAVQGGLLLGLLARRNEDGNDDRSAQRLVLPVLAFLIAKLVAYTLLGFGLGWLGENIQISTTAQLWMQSFAGLLMIVTGIRLIAPNFMPWFNFQPPATVRRFIRHRAKSEALIAPAILGFLTILIPCGTTQAIEVTAIATGNPVEAAMIMSAFTLGTAPLFFIVGVLAKGTIFARRSWATVAALLVIGLGLYSINGVLVAAGSPYNAQNILRSSQQALFGDNQSDSSTAETSPTITVLANGYSPNELTVASGQPITINLTSRGRLGCTSVFRIPSLQLETNVPANGQITLAANFPKPGRYIFTCGMGMYTGVINAV